jgi:hypothetical protein
VGQGPGHQPIGKIHVGHGDGAGPLAHPISDVALWGSGALGVGDGCEL